MADLVNEYVEQNTVQSPASDSTWNDVSGATISGASLSANTKYLIIARALYTNSLDVQTSLRLQTDDDADVATKSESGYLIKRNLATQGMSYFWVHSYTTDASPADLKLQAFAGSGTMYIDGISISVVEMQAMDYLETVVAVGGANLSNSPTMDDIVTIDGAELGTDTWLILAYGRINFNNSSSRGFMELATAVNASSNAVVFKSHLLDGGLGPVVQGAAAIHKASSGTPDAVLRLGEFTGGNTADGGYMVAIKSTTFESLQWSYAASVLAAAGETNLQQIASYTPDTDSDHLIFGSGNIDLSANANYRKLWVEDSTTEIRAGDSANQFGQFVLASAYEDDPINTFQRYNIAGTTTLNLQGDAVAGTDGFANRWLIAASLTAGATGGGTQYPMLQSTGTILVTGG